MRLTGRLAADPARREVFFLADAPPLPDTTGVSLGIPMEALLLAIIAPPPRCGSACFGIPDSPDAEKSYRAVPFPSGRPRRFGRGGFGRTASRTGANGRACAFGRK